MSQEIVVLVTCPAGDGLKIAQPLVQEKLAACVNLVPGLTSVFSWKGQICQEPEQLLIIKSHQDLFEDLKRRLCELHSYDIPEILSFAVADGHAPYLDWLNASLKK